MRFHSWISSRSEGVALPDRFLVNFLVRRDRGQSGFHVQQLNPDGDAEDGDWKPLHLHFSFFHTTARIEGENEGKRDEMGAGLLSLRRESCSCSVAGSVALYKFKGLSSKLIGGSIINQLKIALHWPPAAAGHLNLLPCLQMKQRPQPGTAFPSTPAAWDQMIMKLWLPYGLAVVMCRLSTSGPKKEKPMHSNSLYNPPPPFIPFYPSVDSPENRYVTFPFNSAMIHNWMFSCAMKQKNWKMRDQLPRRPAANNS